MQSCSTIAVVYFSENGATKRLAKTIAGGIKQVGSKAHLLPIESNKIVNGRFVDPELLRQLTKADGIMFGSPTYMGDVAAQFKAFADATSELRSSCALANKFAAGFTTGSSIAGELNYCLNSLFVLSQQHGMIWISMDAQSRGFNPLGSAVGLISHNQNGIFTAQDLVSAQKFGMHIAERCNQYHLKFSDNSKNSNRHDTQSNYAPL